MSLENNLQEIYSAVHSGELVANFKGTHLYNTSTGWGYLWKWFYNIFGCIFNKEEKLQKAIVKTHTIFQDKLKEATQHVEKYRSYLQQKCEEDPVDEATFTQARKGITSWNRKTRQFQKLVEQKNSKLMALFEKYLNYDKEKGNIPFNNPSPETCKDYQMIIDLEGVMHEPIPFYILGKLSAVKEMGQSEQQISKWIEKLNKKKPPIRKFHNFCVAFIRYIRQLPSFSAADLSRLEYALSERKCALFTQKDPKHTHSVKEGDRIFCNNREIVIGEPADRKNGIYTMANDPHHVVMIGINAASLGIKKHTLEKKGWGAQCIKIEEVDRDGRCAIAENLDKPISEYNWTSKGGIISEPDRKVAQPVIGALQWFIQKKKSPRKFSPKHLYAQDKVLKTYKIFSPTLFDYNSLEDFVYKTSKDNATIFKHLMTESRLYGHKCQKFYRKMVEDALSDKKPEFETEAALYRIDDPRVVDRAKKLIKKILKLKKNSSKETLLTLYKESRAGGILWPTIVKQLSRDDQ